MRKNSKSKPDKNLSPAGRQAVREAAQAEALAELEGVRKARRARSARLRKLRLKQDKK